MQAGLLHLRWIRATRGNIQSIWSWANKLSETSGSREWEFVRYPEFLGSPYGGFTQEKPVENLRLRNVVWKLRNLDGWFISGGQMYSGELSLAQSSIFQMWRYEAYWMLSNSAQKTSITPLSVWGNGETEATDPELSSREWSPQCDSHMQTQGEELALCRFVSRCFPRGVGASSPVYRKAS
jgi:hypothetical protein